MFSVGPWPPKTIKTLMCGLKGYEKQPKIDTGLAEDLLFLVRQRRGGR